MNRGQRQRLADARLLAGAKVAQTARTARLGPLRRRSGKLTESVVDVLATADRPVKTHEIRHAVETTTGMPVSGNSLKDCLHKNGRRPDSPIERVARCFYQHRPADASVSPCSA